MKKLRRIVAFMLSIIMVLGSMTNVFAAKYEYKYIKFSEKLEGTNSKISKFTLIEISNDGGKTWENVTDHFKKSKGQKEFVSSNNAFDINEGTMFYMEMVLKNDSEVYSALVNSENYLHGRSYYQCKATKDGGLKIELVMNPYDSITYNVTYTSEEEATGIPEGTEYYKYRSECKVTSVVPAREGYEFVGWLYNNKIYNAGDIIRMGSGHVEFKAVWNAAEYKVTFVDEDGEEISSVDCEYGKQVIKPADPKKADVKVENGIDAATWSTFSFAGWTAEGDYTLDDLNNVTQSMTFKAKYKENPVKVYFFVLNRGQAQKEEPGSYSDKDYSKSVEGSLKFFTAVNNDDEAVANTIFEAPSAEEFGITLNEGESIKWYVVKKINANKWHVDGIIVGQQYDVVVNYVDESGNTLCDSKTVSVAATDEYSVESPRIKGYELVDTNEAKVTGVMPYETVEVTVEYKKTEYNVTYVDALGVEVPVDGNVYTMGDTVEVKANLENDGYRFDGWSYNGVTYKAGDEIKVEAENVVLTANWTKLYTVTYKVDGEVVDEFTVEYGSEVPTSTYKVPEGYEFTGFELVTDVETEMLVKQDMVFEGTTSEIVVEEEEEDINLDTPFAPGAPEEDDNDADNNEDAGKVEDNDENVPEVDVEEEEEDIDLDTPFGSGVQTGDAANYSAYIVVLLIAAVGAMIVAYNKKNVLN